MNIIVFGFKSSGKGFIGKAVAKEGKMEFIDTDDVLEDIYFEKHKERLSYRQIAKKHGMGFFRQIEKQAVERISGKDKVVIATGGGTLLSEENVQALKKNGKLALLKLDKETLFKRIMDGGMPAFFDKEKPRESFENLFNERMPKFEQIADFEVDCNNKKDEDISKEIRERAGKA